MWIHLSQLPSKKKPLTFVLIASLRLLTHLKVLLRTNLDNLHLATKESHFILIK